MGRRESWQWQTLQTSSPARWLFFETIGVFSVDGHSLSAPRSLSSPPRQAFERAATRTFCGFFVERFLFEEGERFVIRSVETAREPDSGLDGAEAGCSLCPGEERRRRGGS